MLIADAFDEHDGPRPGDGIRVDHQA